MMMHLYYIKKMNGFKPYMLDELHRYLQYSLLML